MRPTPLPQTNKQTTIQHRNATQPSNQPTTNERANECFQLSNSNNDDDERRTTTNDDASNLSNSNGEANDDDDDDDDDDDVTTIELL